VDILRAIALVGIVVVNYQSPNLTGAGYAARGGADSVVRTIVDLFFNGKFYPLFSVLFGFGMATQIIKARTRAGGFRLFYLRRLFVLFCIGVLHSILVWQGDILHVYAFWGLLLLACAGLSNRSLLVGGFVLITAGAFQRPLVDLFHLNGSVEQGLQGVRVYASTAAYGSLISRLVSQFVSDGVHLNTYFRQLDIPGLFLLGLYAGRRDLLSDVRGHAVLIRRVMFAAMAIGLFGLGWEFAVRRLAGAAGNAGGMPARIAGLLGGSTPTMIAKLYYKPALAVFYGCALILLLSRPLFVRWLRPLSMLGRMSLTSYLVQCVIAAILFFGFGLYGRVGPAFACALAVAIYTVQIPLSAWWLRRYRFGPMEWVWRSLTYGKRQPLRAT